MAIKYIKLWLFGILFCVLTISQSYAAALYICFSHKDLQSSEKQKLEEAAELKQALKKGDVDSALMLMQFEMSYNSENTYKKGTLEYKIKQKAIFWDAVLGNDIKEVKKYIEAKGDINEIYPVDYFITPLMAASRCGYKEIVQTLIDAGADVNKEGSLVGTYDSMIRGVTALSQAERQEHDEVVEILLKAGAIRKQPYIEKIKVIEQSN